MNNMVIESLKKNSLKLCECCNGIGFDKYINDICPVCKGAKILNRFHVDFTIDVPYVCEEDRYDNAYMILDNVATIYENLGVESAKNWDEGWEH